MSTALEPRPSVRCARETIEEAFSHEANGRAVVETYREIVSTPRTRAAGRPYNLDTLDTLSGTGAGVSCAWLAADQPSHRNGERSVDG